MAGNLPEVLTPLDSRLQTTEHDVARGLPPGSTQWISTDEHEAAAQLVHARSAPLHLPLLEHQGMEASGAGRAWKGHWAAALQQRGEAPVDLLQRVAPEVQQRAAVEVQQTLLSSAEQRTVLEMRQGIAPEGDVGLGLGRQGPMWWQPLQADIAPELGLGPSQPTESTGGQQYRSSDDPAGVGLDLGLSLRSTWWPGGGEAAGGARLSPVERMPGFCAWHRQEQGVAGAIQSLSTANSPHAHGSLPPLAGYEPSIVLLRHGCGMGSAGTFCPGGEAPNSGEGCASTVGQHGKLSDAARHQLSLPRHQSTRVDAVCSPPPKMESSGLGRRAESAQELRLSSPQGCVPRRAEGVGGGAQDGAQAPGLSTVHGPEGYEGSKDHVWREATIVIPSSWRGSQGRFSRPFGLQTDLGRLPPATNSCREGSAAPESEAALPSLQELVAGGTPLPVQPMPAAALEAPLYIQQGLGGAPQFQQGLGQAAHTRQGHGDVSGAGPLLHGSIKWDAGSGIKWPTLPPHLVSSGGLLRLPSPGGHLTAAGVEKSRAPGELDEAQVLDLVDSSGACGLQERQRPLTSDLGPEGLGRLPTQRTPARLAGASASESLLTAARWGSNRTPGIAQGPRDMYTEECGPTAQGAQPNLTAGSQLSSQLAGVLRELRRKRPLPPVPSHSNLPMACADQDHCTGQLGGEDDGRERLSQHPGRVVPLPSGKLPEGRGTALPGCSSQAQLSSPGARHSLSVSQSVPATDAKTVDATGPRQGALCSKGKRVKRGKGGEESSGGGADSRRIWASVPGLYSRRNAADGTFAPARLPRSIESLASVDGDGRRQLSTAAVRQISQREMVERLLAFAAAVETRDKSNMKWMERELRLASCAFGDAVQRAGFHFLRALKVRAATTDVEHLFRPPDQFHKNGLPAIVDYTRKVPFLRLAVESAVKAVAQAAEGRSNVHIFIVGCTYMLESQLPHLIQRLGHGRGGPPRRLTLTLVDTSFRALGARELRIREERMKSALKSLQQEADMVGIRCLVTRHVSVGMDCHEKLEALLQEVDSEAREGLRRAASASHPWGGDTPWEGQPVLQPAPQAPPSVAGAAAAARSWKHPAACEAEGDETRVVVSVLTMYYAPDARTQSVDIKDYLIQWMKRLRPVESVFVDADLPLSGKSFLPRLRTCLNHYLNLFSSHDNLAADIRDVILGYEERILGHRLLNIVAGEGQQRIIHAEAWQDWGKRLWRQGFVAVSLAEELLEGIQHTLDKYPWTCVIKVKDLAMVLLWKDQPMVVTSRWKLR